MRRARLGRRRLRGGKAHDDAGSAPPDRRALRDDRPAHRFDQPAGDREAKAGAGLAPVGAPAAVEFLEDAFEFAWLHAGAFVGDAEHDLVALLARVNGRACVAAIFVRVVEQIEQDLLEQLVVAAHERQVRREADPHRLAWERFAAALGRALHDVGDGDQIAIDLEAAGFDPRHVEQIGDEARQPRRLLFDRGQEFEPLGRTHLVAERAQRASPRRRSRRAAC